MAHLAAENRYVYLFVNMLLAENDAKISYNRRKKRMLNDLIRKLTKLAQQTEL